MSDAQYVKAGDGRTVAIVIRHDFDAFEKFPPKFDTDAERQWLKEHYSVRSPELERKTKAHITDDSLPLQVTILNRPGGAVVKPHYHTNEGPASSDTRHQIMLCMSGQVKVGVFAKEGRHLADVVLETGDFVLLYEGHSFETLVDGTRLVEIKQGPMPADHLSDNVAIDD